MRTKMVNIRLDEKEYEELEWFIRNKKTTITETVRNALKEYLGKGLTWEDIEHELVPFITSCMNGYDIIGIIKPDVTLAKVVDKEIPILISSELNGKRFDFGIILSQEGDDILVKVGLYHSDIERIENDFSETFFMLKRDLGKETLKENLTEFFNYFKRFQ